MVTFSMKKGHFLKPGLDRYEKLQKLMKNDINSMEIEQF